MVTRSFLISFEYRLDEGRITINLRAEVELHPSSSYYIVRNIRSLQHGNSPAIPEVRLTKKAAEWVHVDSQRPTDLTRCIGEAIDALGPPASR